MISEDRKTTLTYTFHPDGTLTTYEVCTGGENFTNSEKGKYEVQGNVLKIWYLEELGSKPSVSDFRIEGDKLILVSEYGWESIFTRKN